MDTKPYRKVQVFRWRDGHKFGPVHLTLDGVNTICGLRCTGPWTYEPEDGVKTCVTCEAQKRLKKHLKFNSESEDSE